MIRVNSQSFSLSSTLKKKNAHEDEQQQLQQQQIINSKYNSLPIQHQQTRQTTNLNHVNNNSIPNGGTHYQQHNYSSQVHQYQHQQQQQQQQQQQSPSQRQYHSTGSNNNQDRESTAATSLRLSYVTERILASILPARRAIRNGTTTPVPGCADEHERELIEMLEQKHEKNYRIFDLESCIASISLEKLCELCKHIDSWLGSGKEKIVVLQDREDKQRLGTAIAAYLEYQKICGSNFPQSNRTKALQSPGGPGSDLSGRRTPTWLDLDIYSTQKFLESITGPLRIPSHKRYIKYFSGLLSGTIKMNAASLFLRAIIVESPPCLHYRAITVNSEWRSFIKIYEGVRCLFTSDIYVIPITTRQFIYEIKHPLRLRGDILIRCYQIIPNNNKLHDEKELISCVQFHTCAITEREVQFTKVALDLACNDERFPADHKVTLSFDTTPNERSAILVFQNPLVRIEPIIEGGDHLETVNEDESSHTHGPLDGSLYATILKSPKSPTGSSSGQTLISPPAEFSNGKPIPNGHHHPVPPVTPPPRSSSALSSASYSIYESAKRGYQSATTTSLSNSNSPVVNGSVYQQQQQPLGGSSRGPVVGGESANISHSETSGNIVVNSSSSNSAGGSYRNVIENGGSGAAYDQNQNLVNQSQQQQQQQTQIRSQADGRESVRSPLTLSMDSGISSSGPVNRRLQGSSVSPSSFPSQASPQDDRHRELDDLLSDMLMTVQGIPDVGRSKGATTAATTPSASSAQATHHHHHHHHHLHHQQQQQQQQNLASDHFVNTNTDTVKRSHSAQLPALRESAKERELLLYETSSTTTTLTPPPSESGRETPLLSSAYSTIRDKRDLCLTPTERELLMNLQQHQSFGYPRQARSTTGASERFTSDDDDDHYGSKQIPYHAREDSRPFTYGSIPLTGTPQNPPASTMLKMQSGLSSPSMVRKALGTPTSARKSTGMGGGTGGGSGAGPYGGGLGRNSEFEEMLRERREKVFSEKYTIGDQSPRGTDTVDNRWNYSTTIRTTVDQQNDTNGYPHPHEPLKRSNTMDGSFGRQFSNDGISGQTWLQLQQQKLRARKEQQKREHSNSFSYSYGSPAFPTNNTSDTLYNTTHRRSQTLSPVRNDRSYHTLTTTHTRTNSTERPFVAVKRAHESAKMQTIGSAPLSVLNASPHGHIAQAQQQQQSPSSQPTTSSAPSPSPSMASTIEHHQQQQHGSGSNANSSSSPIHNGHHQHHSLQHTLYQQQQQQHDQQHHVSFDSSVVSQNGLLSLADQDHSTPKHGHARLESEQIIFSNIDCLNNLDTSEKLNNLLKDITNSASAVQRAVKSNGHALLPLSSAISVANNSVVTSTSNNPSAATSNTFATTTTSSTTTINHHHQQQPQPNHARFINHTHSNHYQNGHRRPPAPDPMDISPTTEERECLRIGEDPKALTRSGQLALDKLLASLALESDVTEQHLAQIDQQQQLSAVIANLTEYNLSEAQRLNAFNGNDLGGDAFRTHADIVNGNGFHHQVHQNSLNGRANDPGSLLLNNHVRRLASESDSTISSISPSLSERSNAISWCDQAREESFSSYRSETEPDNSPAGGSPRPETPAFPVTPRTPYGLSNGSSSPALPPKSPTSQRKYNSTWSLRSQKSTMSTYDVSKDLFTGSQQRSQQEIINQNDTVSCYTSRRNSTTSNANSEPQEVAPQFVKFARDSSKYWYKPNISREEAIALLRNAPPGTFVVRDSTTFANAYGLVVKVTHPPPGVQSKGPNSEELVRHFLVEPTIRGVRLKGCSNEPVFTSLSALVYQHSITPLALPCRLIIPDTDLQQSDLQSPGHQQLLMQGAACNVLYLFTCDTESLTGPQAIRKGVGLLLSLRPLPKPTQVHFKVSIQGITLTDNTRQLFFRRHYPSNNVSFCGLDPDEHRWSIPSSTGDIPSNKRIFAFVAKRSPTSADNQCHVFCELEATQPATAIVSFANKVVLGGTSGQQPAPTRAI
ncbi:uncharacterized protein LOC134224884 isoform X2 [Armigeres subalbatus]|uniref:uncharacterized protein LOC134224884 isoform X2 n=1 Tax=Armigeres subalbatus TaxID=124917 RepID=UPI002ED4C107